MATVGTGLGNVVRVVTSRGGRNLFSGLLAGGTTMVSSFGRVLRLLLLQVFGFIFLVIAVMLGSKAVHEYQAFAATHNSPSRVYVSIFFCAMFTYFGVSSFWRARK